MVHAISGIVTYFLLNKDVECEGKRENYAEPERRSQKMCIIIQELEAQLKVSKIFEATNSRLTILLQVLN